MRLGQTVFLGSRLDGDPCGWLSRSGWLAAWPTPAPKLPNTRPTAFATPSAWAQLVALAKIASPSRIRCFKIVPSLRTRLRAPLVLLAVPCRQPVFLNSA